MKKISYVIPCYRSEQTIADVVKDIRATMRGFAEKYEYEIVLVNDCSPDDTYRVIQSLAQQYQEVKGASLSINFGQQGALMAGFSIADGDMIVCLDDDGQTPPSEVGKPLDKFEQGYDVVFARYKHKKHSIFRNIGSKVNDWMAHALLGKPNDLYVSSYFIADRFVIDEIIKYKNPYPYILGLILRTTRNITDVPVEHKKRVVGESGYTIGKLLGLWLNGFTAFSIVPLRAASALGACMALLSIIYLIYIIIRKLIISTAPIGWSSIICAVLFVGGIIMCMLGMLGEYVGRMYISINDSPQFVIKERTFEEKNEGN